MTTKRLGRFALALCFGFLLQQSGAASAHSASAQSADDDPVLSRTISALDTKVFDAYNRCDLDAFGSYFTPTVEFYHDKGGATFDRETVIANTRKYICDKVRRELLPETLKIYPIKDYGAIEEGEHRFCHIGTKECEGIAKFLIIWQHKDGNWQITRVLSYGHRAIAESSR